MLMDLKGFKSSLAWSYGEYSISNHYLWILFKNIVHYISLVAFYNLINLFSITIISNLLLYQYFTLYQN